MKLDNALVFVSGGKKEELNSENILIIGPEEESSFEELEGDWIDKNRPVKVSQAKKYYVMNWMKKSSFYISVVLICSFSNMQVLKILHSMDTLLLQTNFTFSIAVQSFDLKRQIRFITAILPASS